MKQGRVRQWHRNVSGMFVRNLKINMCQSHIDAKRLRSYNAVSVRNSYGAKITEGPTVLRAWLKCCPHRTTGQSEPRVSKQQKLGHDAFVIILSAVLHKVKIE